jgi:hypothetical protein
VILNFGREKRLFPIPRNLSHILYTKIFDFFILILLAPEEGITMIAKQQKGHEGISVTITIMIHDTLSTLDNRLDFLCTVYTTVLQLQPSVAALENFLEFSDAGCRF